MAAVNLDKIKSLAERIRVETIKTGYGAGRKGAHFGGALSCIELLACLYGGIMDIDVNNPTKEPRDVFLLSKGHASVSFYAALACAGYFPMTDLQEFEADGSELSAHPIMNEAKGVELSTGSLGMGIGTGIGMALGYRRKGYDNHVFVLMGDGECDEGAVWEGSMAAASFGLDSLVVIVDKNSIQSDGTTKEIMDLLDLGEKFASFGFDVREIDGHDTEKICHTFSELLELRNGKPKVVIANTIKGKGISFMENKPEWHHSALSEKQYKEAMQELGQEVSE